MADAAIQEPHKLDEVMLAMDVVDTIRHDALLLEQDLRAPEREQELIDRLREIYHAQGIEVPDHILREGVKALDDHRFAYTPQKHSFLSKAYITRGKWGKPLIVVLAMIGLAWGIEYAAFEAPKKREAKRIERALTVDYPKALEEARDAGLSVAATPALKERVSALYNSGMDALTVKDAKTAEARTEDLNALVNDLRQTYTVRIVSRPGENSGIFRVDDDAPNVKNYYLIVEALDAAGKVVPVTITSEENQATERVKIWGVRVPEEVYLGVAADKRDDQIIQNAVIGQKKRGYLEPDFTIRTEPGRIVRW